jgi:hypothetical protein
VTKQERLAHLLDVQADNLEAWSSVMKFRDGYPDEQVEEFWSLIEETEAEINKAKRRIEDAGQAVAGCK